MMPCQIAGNSAHMQIILDKYKYFLMKHIEITKKAKVVRIYNVSLPGLDWIWF